MHSARSPIEGTPFSSPAETALALSPPPPPPPTSPAPISETLADAASGSTAVGRHRKSTAAPFDSAAISLPYACDSDGAASSAWPPLDVRVRPWLFTVTYWTGLAVVYAFAAYVVVFSSSWRGPVLVWAVLVPTVVGAAWRLLPSERRLIERKSDEVLLLRCGGLFSLADADTPHHDTDGEGQPQEELRRMDEDRPTSADGGSSGRGSAGTAA